MKTLNSSDMNVMVLSTMTNAAVRLEIPVSTAVTWGAPVLPPAIGGTATLGVSDRRQDCSAIWGTAGIWTPPHPVVMLLPSITPTVRRASQDKPRAASRTPFCASSLEDRVC